MEVYKRKRPVRPMKVEIGELKEILFDLLLPEDDIEELVEKIKAKGYVFDAQWLARHLLTRGMSRQRVKELFRRLEVEDPAIAYIIKLATQGTGEDPAVLVVGGEERPAGDRLRTFQEVEDDEDGEGEGEEEALRDLYGVRKGGEGERG